MKGVAMKREENPGKPFTGFMKYYRRGEAERIIYDLDKLGLSITN